jgi:hypothetical protein
VRTEVLDIQEDGVAIAIFDSFVCIASAEHDLLKTAILGRDGLELQRRFHELRLREESLYE